MRNALVNERVAVYVGGHRLQGVVAQVLSDDACRVTTGTGTFVAHTKQLRRLVKKKRREFWVVWRPDGEWGVFGNSNGAHSSAGLVGEVIHVREVKK